MKPRAAGMPKMPLLFWIMIGYAALIGLLGTIFSAFHFMGKTINLDNFFIFLLFFSTITLGLAIATLIASKKGSRQKDKKDSFEAKVAFIISMGFWVPLFNIAISLISGYYAIQAIRKYRADPKRYGGLGYAIVALIISLGSLIMTLLGLGIFIMSDMICNSAICQ